MTAAQRDGGPFAGVVCRTCGPVDITEAEYDRQMDRPDSSWVCPKCGGFAGFDDERFEELMDAEEMAAAARTEQPE